MKTYLDCFPCFVRQALEASRMAGADEALQHRVLLRTMEHLATMGGSETPPEIGYLIHRMVRQSTGVDDPYRDLKAVSTTQALALYPWMVAQVAAAHDPLACAVQLAIAGNIIDFAQTTAPRESAALRESVRKALARPLTIDDLGILRAALTTAHEVLYLADNAGETVFDRVLLATLADTTDHPLTLRYAVKGAPVLNDATREDALAAGIGEVAEIVSSGSDAAGTILETCSPAFRELFAAAPLIIAKGQANYETLSEDHAPLVFLLRAKCPVIARDVGAPVGSMICEARQILVGASA